MNNYIKFSIITLLSIILIALIMLLMENNHDAMELKLEKLNRLEMQRNQLEKDSRKEFEKMKLTSSVFENNRNIPSKYTCDGDDISPPLHIENVPENAKSLVLICDDPDAPVDTFVHWVMYNIPVDTKEIRENISDHKVLPDGSMQGISSFGKLGYGGPCPPSGTHRYFFKLYALDKALSFYMHLKEEESGAMLTPEELTEPPTKEKVESAIKGHIISESHLIGLYKRNK